MFGASSTITCAYGFWPRYAGFLVLNRVYLMVFELPGTEYSRQNYDDDKDNTRGTLGACRHS